MIFTNPKISDLPDLNETINFLKEITSKFPIVHRSPYSPILEDSEIDILTRSGDFYSIKPNVSCQGALFGWCNNFERYYKNNEINSNENNSSIMLYKFFRSEFERILDSNPLYSLLKNGFSLPGLHNPIRIFNPDGLALSYGLESPFIPLTSSIDVAAFHASHSYNINNDTFDPIEDENRTGVIFVFELKELFSMIPGLYIIGRQPFQRPGLNKLFAYYNNGNPAFHDLSNVKGFQFRQTSVCSHEYYELFNHGKRLFPNEPIVEKIKRLRYYKSIAELSFKDELKKTQNVNIISGHHLIRNLNYPISKIVFGYDELYESWFRGVDENWAEFWTNTCFTRLNERQFQHLINLPHNPIFKKYFNLSEWIVTNKI